MGIFNSITSKQIFWWWQLCVQRLLFKFISLLFSAMMVLRLEEMPLLIQAITHSKFQLVLSDRWRHLWLRVIAIIIPNYSIEAPPDYKQYSTRFIVNACVVGQDIFALVKAQSLYIQIDVRNDISEHLREKRMKTRTHFFVSECSPIGQGRYSTLILSRVLFPPCLNFGRHLIGLLKQLLKCS